MKRSSFLSLILLLTAVWMQVYSSARHMFNGVAEYKAEVQQMKAQSEQEKLAMVLEREQFLEFRQNVATLMPEELKKHGMGLAGYPYRSLASTISRQEAEKVREAIAKTLFERGKEYFRKQQYAKAEHVFQEVIDRYSYTPYVAEGFFLLSESQYQQNELESAVATIQRMIELFPHHELTGFAMIRLGRIYEAQNRTEEAVDIYQTVLRAYPQRDVASQAKASLKGIDL